MMSYPSRLWLPWKPKSHNHRLYRLYRRMEF